MQPAQAVTASRTGGVYRPQRDAATSRTRNWGGCGHSRLRAFVLGGVTRSILETMTVPTLMSH